MMQNDRKGRGNFNNQDRPALPENYLMGGYFEDPKEKQKLKPDYIIAYARKIARDLDNEGRGNKNKRTQIRKYYDYCLRLQKKMERMNNDFSFVESDFARLIPVVEYAESRARVSQIFVEFIEKNVAAIKDARDLGAYIKHFESVVAYMKKDN